MPKDTKVTFYAGINEIGGNKFLVEDKGTRIFLDFGMQMGRANDYFAQFLTSRTLNGMGDPYKMGSIWTDFAHARVHSTIFCMLASNSTSLVPWAVNLYRVWIGVVGETVLATSFLLTRS